jgi:DNA-binding IclR family transcriptional regulator
MSEENYNNVFNLLVKHRSMPFLQLSALSDLDESQLRQILDDLEKKGMVRITNKLDSFKEIITIKERAFTARPTFGD